MLGFFTDPYPDEILYSVCARYHWRAGNGSTMATARDLFGHEASQVAVDLPSRIGHLVSQLPPGHRCSADRLIDDHTLLPFYAPFMPPARLRQLRTDMTGAPDGGSIHGRSGILTSHLSLEYLRFCPRCIEEDRAQYGEPYWHRIHQVPGVMACPVHQVFLESSDIRTLGRGKKEALITAKQAVRQVPARLLDPSNRDHQAHLLIARDAAWLLQQTGIATDPAETHKRYLVLLFNVSLASYAGKVHISELQERFQGYHTPALLQALSSGLQRKYCWLRRLAQTPRSAQHPIRHLLLMHFLGHSVGEFFQLPAEAMPFGSPPFPCLNPAANHYLEDRIMNYEVKYKQRGNREITGTFYCDCGFVYRRYGRGEAGEHRHTMNRIMAFGPVWEDALRWMFKEDGRNFEGMARQLGVPVHTVKKQVSRLCLAGNGRAKRPATLGRPKESPAGTAAKRAEYRRQWRQAVRNNPSASRSDIRKRVPTAYNWLILRDKQWLEGHSPKPRRPEGPPAIVDWQKRDDELAAKVKETAGVLKNTDGRPARASRAAIMRALKVQALVTKNTTQLPLAVEALKEMAESIEDYAVRRVQWAAKCFLQEGTRAGRWQLIGRATFSHSVAALPKVSDALDAAVEMLEAASARGWN